MLNSVRILMRLKPGIWSVAFFGSLILLASARAQDAEKVRADIIKAWKGREKQTETLDCEWSAQAFCSARSWCFEDDKREFFYLPADDFVYHSDFRFRFKGPHKFRYEYTGPQPNYTTKSYELRDYVSVTDGQVQKSLFGQDKGARESRFPAGGFSSAATELPETNMVHLLPPFLLYRPFALNIVKDFELYSLKGTVLISGRECLLFEHNTDDRTYELVIDMNRGCAPIRYRYLQKDSLEAGVAPTWRLWSQVEIDLADEPDGGWRPKGWKTIGFKSDGQVQLQLDTTVQKLAINGDLPDSVFQIEFPVGTVVRDTHTQEYYILRERGEKRPITEAEQMAQISYEQLLATNPDGSIHSSTRRKWYFWVGVLAGGLMLIGLVWRYVRAWKAKSLNPQ